MTEESGECKECGKTTIMYSYLGNCYYCLEHYDKFIKSIKSIMIKWIKCGKNNKEFIDYLRDRRVILIGKNNMDIEDPLSYRPIAINNIFIRIFLKILLNKINYI